MGTNYVLLLCLQEHTVGAGFLGTKPPDLNLSTIRRYVVQRCEGRRERNVECWSESISR
jgi:hypothetical protein